MPMLKGTAVNKTLTIGFFDVTSEFFTQFPDEAVDRKQFLKWVSEKPNAQCAAIVSMMEDKAAHQTVAVNVSVVLTSTNPVLVE